MAIGGHWLVLQSAAWLGMFASNRTTASMAEAWSKTFDGKHLCKLCKVVREGKKAEKTQDRQKIEIKLDLLLVARQGIIFRRLGPTLPLNCISLPNIRNDSPPTPPPRALPG